MEGNGGNGGLQITRGANVGKGRGMNDEGPAEDGDTTASAGWQDSADITVAAGSEGDMTRHTGGITPAQGTDTWDEARDEGENSGEAANRVGDVDNNDDGEEIYDESNSEEEEDEEEYEEEDNGGEDEDEDESVEELNEPKLKYERLGNSMLHILQEDFASCMCVFERFIALGTRSGRIYILDFKGNEIRRFSSHKSVVNEVCVDGSGEFIASCSDDGKVVLNALYAPEPSVFSYNRVIRCVAVDPNYAHRTTRCYLSGGPSGHLESRIKGWFGNKSQVVHKDEGAIHALQWKGTLIAFATDHRVVILDSRSMSPIAAVTRDADAPAPSQYRCCLVWESSNVLIIGWADDVTIVRMTERDISGNRSQWHKETLHQFKTPFWICGIAPFGADLVVLAYYDIEEDGEVARPELKILSREGGIEHASDILKIHGYERYSATDYRLDSLHEDSLYYVVAPKDVVVARQRDVDDRVTWLLQLATQSAEVEGAERAEQVQQWYEDACAAALKNESLLRKHTVLTVGESYLHYLLSEKRFDTAAEWCPKILRHDAHSWENWILRFSYMKQLPALSRFIPISNPRLGQGQYEMVLGSFLSAGDFEGFRQLVDDWPNGLYDVDVISTAVQRQMEDNGGSEALKLALVKLYTLSQQFDKALHLYLALRHKGVFDFIKTHQLFDSVANRVLQLITFNERAAVELLVDHTDRIPIKSVVKQLDDHPYCLHLYLHALFQRDHRLASEYHGRQVELYANYKQELLLPFLRVSDSYPLEMARAICEEKRLYRELVYVLDRMGSVHEALLLLIVDLNDVEGAIRFVLEKKDDTLWGMLISYSLRSPEMVSELLDHMGVLEDPLQLIRRIPTQVLSDLDGNPLRDDPPSDGGDLVLEIEHCVHMINERPSLLVFAEAVSADVANEMRKTLGKVALASRSAAGSRNVASQDRVMFFWAGLNGERTADIRRQLFLPDAGADVTMVFLDVQRDGRFFLFENIAKGAPISESHVSGFLAACSAGCGSKGGGDRRGSKVEAAGSRRGLMAGDVISQLTTEKVLGMEIPGLRDKLTRVTRDVHNELSLMQGCQRILNNDVVALTTRLYTNAREGLRLGPQLSCTMCAQAIVNMPTPPPGQQQRGGFLARGDNLCAFFCGHIYHLRCLPNLHTPGRNSVGSDVGGGLSDALLNDTGISEEFEADYFCPVCKAESTKKRSVVGGLGAHP